MSWRDFFRRKPTRPPSPPSIRIIDLRDSPEEWHVGDKAICILDGPWVNIFTRVTAVGPEGGRIYEVTRVTVEYGAQCLGFAEFGCLDYLAQHFRKVRPDEREACTEAFRKLLNRKPEPVAA